MAKPTTPTPQESKRGGPGGLLRARAGAGRPAGQAAGAPSAGSFYRESLAELRKVTWPSRQDAMNLTTAVIGMTVAMSLFLALVDGGLDQIVTKILGG